MTNPLYQKHIISINDLDREDLESVLHVANKLKQQPNNELLKDKVIASCFLKHQHVLAYHLRQLFTA